MDRTIEQTFFEAFELGGVVGKCFDWTNRKYDLDPKWYEGDENKPQKALSDVWRHHYDVVLPKWINDKTKVFNDSGFFSRDNSVIDEIARNIDECTTDKQRERYVFLLLKPFKEFSDVFFPIAIIKQLKGEVGGIVGIKDLERDLHYWEGLSPNELFDASNNPAGTAGEQAEACKEMILNYEYRIKRAEYVASKYFDLLCRFEDDAEWRKEGTVESCLSAFCGIIHEFANRLDALLLERGINLLWYQQESGIYLKAHRPITDVDSYIWSYELAIKYIDEALPELIEPQSSVITIPKELDTPQFKSILDKAIEAGFVEVVGGAYKWVGRTKELLAYFVETCSLHIELRRGKLDKNNRPTISWVPFEALFNEKRIKVGKDNWLKTKTTFHPTGHETIDVLFK